MVQQVALMHAEGSVKGIAQNSERTWFRRHSTGSCGVEPCAVRAVVKPTCCLAKPTLIALEPTHGLAPDPFSLTSPLGVALKACDSTQKFPISREKHACSIDSTDSGSTSTRSDVEVDDEAEHVHDDLGLPKETPDVLEENQNAPSTSNKSNMAMTISADSSLRKVVALAALTVVCGCACQTPYEVMNKHDKGCAPLICLAEYMFGLAASLKALRMPRRLPWHLHFGTAAADCGYGLLVGFALSSKLPTTVLITMKNGNLVSNMLLGRCILGRQYNWKQYLAVSFVTAGLVLASLSGGSKGWQGASSGLSEVHGIVFILGALFCRAASGVLQEMSCQKYSAPVMEMLFYRSALGLPVACLRWQPIWEHAARWSTAPQVSDFPWPTMWILLLMNIAFDYCTKMSISKFIGCTSALAATLVLTFQRFVSFVISATLLSNNVLGWDLWFAAFAVLAGTVLFAVTSSTPRPNLKASKQN